MLATQQTSPCLLTLVDYHHPVLRQPTHPVPFPLSEEDKQIIQDMKYSIQPEQLKKANAPWEAAVGMAANQWGIPKRIFLYCPEGDAVNGLEVILNPSYEPISEAPSDQPQQDDLWEGCFSVPLASGHVQRYTHIRITYQDEEGKTQGRELRGWPARVWQHENDHLNGFLYDDPTAGKCHDKRQFSSKEAVDEFYKIAKTDRKICPCGTGQYYKACCGPYLQKEAVAPTPEALMRSRYTAYATGDMQYIQETMQDPALSQWRKKTKSTPPPEWIGLEVIKAHHDPENPHVGYVEFIAKYTFKNTEGAMHELSRFQYEQGRWYYVDGEFCT